MFKRLVPLLLAVTLTGCANMASHDTKIANIEAASRTGGLQGALAQLDSTVKTEEEKAGMLYNMERGELLRMDRRYPDSTSAFLKADEQVNKWETEAKNNSEKLLGTLGAALISERLKVYEGQDYEKVWLATRLALNRVATNDFDNARVDIKRTHEREAVIAEFRAKETVAAEEEAKSKGVEAKGKELNGYPVESLNDPEVLQLKNGYQNALSHYLAGFLYEAMNEPGLAAPGYRKAIELKPETPVLEEGLRGLDTRTGFMQKRRQRMTDVLFVLEAGTAPARKSVQFTVPIPYKNRVNTVSISYPVIQPSKDPLVRSVTAGGTQFNLEKVVDLNVMARRVLKDEMPGMVVRNITRAFTKLVMQDELSSKGGTAGAFLSLIGTVAAVVTEQADDRMWRMLPGRVYIARGYLPPGEHSVFIDGRDYKISIKVDGQYALVPLRLYEDRALVGDIGSTGVLAAIPPPTPVEAPKIEEKPVKKVVPSKPTAKPSVKKVTS
jgi:hypothetical protein